MLTFSIVIPVYPPHFKFIQSVLNQIDSFVVDTSQYNISEVVISASNTKTLPAFQSKYTIINSYVEHACNASMNRNRGWELSTGDFIVFLDADDIYHPEKIAITFETIMKLPDTNCLLHSYVFADRDIPTISRDFEIVTNDTIKHRTYPNGYEIRVPGENVCITANDSNIVHHGISTVRRSIAHRFNEKYNYGEDCILVRDILWNTGGVVFIDIALMKYMH
jgi:glycosyltransferase involved in cell wall biosynthesis